jgi:hypothetical protein
MALYDDPDRLLQTMRDFLHERPEWQGHTPLDEDGKACLSPPIFYHFVAWAEYCGFITDEEAVGWLYEMGERFAFLEEAHRRIDAVDSA